MIRSILIFIASLSLTMKASAALGLRILTHNIRYATTSPSTDEKPWANRKQLILNELHYNTVYNAESFICLQEVLHNQVIDIMSGLGADWTYIGVGRDDGKEAGEYSPIIFRKGVWDLDSWKTIWLNEDGRVGKKGWDAGSVRIVTVGHFTHVKSKKKIVGMSTHLDNSGEVSRRESAKIILQLIDTEGSTNATAEEDKVPCFLAGDLNSETSGEAYQLFNAKTSPIQDAKELAKWKYGNTNTFTDFDDKDMTLIDFVFLGPRGGTRWAVEGYSVLPNKFEDGVYNSDHRAVVVDGVLAV
jgi:endonuclease/exonuclease/phosphatase family metal-dependent hydrolase